MPIFISKKSKRTKPWDKSCPIWNNNKKEETDNVWEDFRSIFPCNLFDKRPEGFYNHFHDILERFWNQSKMFMCIKCSSDEDGVNKESIQYRICDRKSSKLYYYFWGKC